MAKTKPIVTAYGHYKDKCRQAVNGNERNEAEGHKTEQKATSILDQATRLVSCFNVVDVVSLTSTMTSSATFVSGDGEKLMLSSQPRRFYIDDILASEFGRHRLEVCTPVSVGSELNGSQWTVADTAAGNHKHHPNIADSTVSLKNDTSSELHKSTGALVVSSKMSTSRTSSFSMTSSRRFHDNGILTDATSSSSSSTGCHRRAALKEAVKHESYPSTTTEITSKNGTSGTICDVTSSTTSRPAAAMFERKPGSKTDDKDRLTLPAWVFCTRYSDRPSAGNV